MSDPSRNARPAPPSNGGLQMPAKSEVKTGFWIGLGVALALLVIGFLQALTLRAVRRDG